MNIRRVNNLNLQSRFGFLVIFTVLMVTIVTTFFLYVLVWQNVRDLEKEQAERSVQRLKYIVSREASALEDIAVDYSKWDDSYQFAVDSNQDYLDSNMVDETFRNYRWKLAAIFNVNNNLLFSKEYDPENDQEVALSQDDQKAISEIKDSFVNNRIDNGFVLYKDKPLLVAIQPILTSDKEGPTRGYFLIARSFDRSTADRLTNSLQFKVTITDVLKLSDNQRKIFDKVKDKEDKQTIEKNDKETTTGYLLLEDPTGKPLSLIEVEILGQSFFETILAIIYFLLVCGTMCIIAGILVYLFVSRSIISRLKELNRFIEVIKADSTHSARLTVKENDEISDLERSFNHLLDSLESCRRVSKDERENNKYQ